MKVYITYSKDGYGGEMVDKVFKKRENAIKYIIDTKLFWNEEHSHIPTDKLEDEALKYIDTFELK